MLSQDCVFCNMLIANAPRPVDWYRYGPWQVVRFTPLNPVVPGHKLFVPAEHVKDAGDNPEVTAEVFHVAAQFAKWACQDYNLITSAGTSATQSVFHLHVHLVPRKIGDGLQLPWTNPRSAKFEAGMRRVDRAEQA